jgi:hypothetical protein
MRPPFFFYWVSLSVHEQEFSKVINLNTLFAGFLDKLQQLHTNGLFLLAL